MILVVGTTSRAIFTPVHLGATEIGHKVTGYRYVLHARYAHVCPPWMGDVMFFYNEPARALWQTII